MTCFKGFISSPLRVAYLSFKNQRGSKPPCQEFFTYDARMRSHFIVNIEKIATRQLAIPIRVDAKTQSFHETIGKHPIGVSSTIISLCRLDPTRSITNNF